MVAVAFDQPLGLDGREVALCCAVVKMGGWDLWWQVEVDGDGVALIGANFLLGLIEGKALFVVIGHQLGQLYFGHGRAVFAQGFQQIIDRNPALCIQLQLEVIWPMS